MAATERQFMLSSFLRIVYSLPNLGSISQWGEVSKTKKDRSKSKAKDTALADSANQSSRVSRGGRAGFDGGRGGGRGRGSGTDRGRGGRARGASTAHTNGSRNKENVESSVPTTESSAWEAIGATTTTDAPSGVPTAKPAEDNSVGWGSTAAEAVSSTAAVAGNVTSSIIPDGVKKSWASMFAKPAPAPAPTPKALEPVEKYAFQLRFERDELTFTAEPSNLRNLKNP